MTTKEKLPVIRWHPEVLTQHGSSVRESCDGMFKIVVCDRYDDIPMKRCVSWWQFKSGRWVRIGEGRSIKAAEKACRIRAAQLDELE
jgi:hypothetical protein